MPARLPVSSRLGDCQVAAVALGIGLATAVGCSGAGSPAAPSPSAEGLIVTGTITDRLAKSPLGGSTIFFKGPVNVSAQVAPDGTYQLDGLVVGEYDVSVIGPLHVPHETEEIEISSSKSLSLSVVPMGATAFGATIDETFQRFFHQLARVSSASSVQLRKWVILPTELYLVEGTVPAEQFAVVRDELERVNAEVVPALWCDGVGPLRITTGPDAPSDVDGRIVVRPNWDDGTGGTVGQILVRSGRVRLNVFRSGDNRVQTPQEVRGILAHELFHVAGAFHVCGGGLGENPFGFSRENCPFPDSLMANLGDLPWRPSPEDRLASCLIYSPDTVPGNRYQDINPYYARR